MNAAALPAPTPMHAIEGFVSLAEKTARSKLTYRASALVSFVASGFAYAIFLLVWLEVYRQNGDVGPMPRQVMLPYLLAAFVLNSILTLSVELRFNQRLRQGLITSDLIRPLGFLPYQMAQAVGDVMVNSLFAFPVYAAALWFMGRAALPPNPGAALLGMASAALSFLVQFAIGYLIVQGSFLLQSAYGIIFTRMALHQVLSGLSAPLVMFPPALRSVALWSPFRHVIETPVSIWLGQAPLGAVPGLFAMQAAWAGGLLLLGESLFGAALRRHQVQGG